MGELTIDQIRHILDNAPEWAKGYNTVISQYVRSCWFSKDIPLSDLKAQVDQHYYGQSEEEELKQYAVLSHEKIEGGAMLVGEFNVNHLSKFAEYQDVIANQQSKIEQLEKQQRINSECINNLVQQKADYLHKVTMAIAHLDSFDHSRAGMNQLVRSIESALEALRGECG